MAELSEWADQYRAEIEKLASRRAAQLESLLIAEDYQACHEFLAQWEEDDLHPESTAAKYAEVRRKLRFCRM
jgi:hypothetical protein